MVAGKRLGIAEEELAGEDKAGQWHLQKYARHLNLLACCLQGETKSWKLLGT